MAKDNNNINTDELTAMLKLSDSVNNIEIENNEHEINVANVTTNVESNSVHIEAPRREENPFSFKHFLKRDSSLGTGCTTTTKSNSNVTNINHSRSTSNINGNTNNNNNNNNGNTSSPSKSATTSALHNNTTGARPKIPQFQSVHTLSNESKMKRSPRFPSFDSQSSLSDLGDDKFISNIYHSRSNNSFNSDYPVGNSTSANPQYVTRSFSNYDMESPGSGGSPKMAASQIHNSPNSNYGNRSRENINAGHRIGTSEFSAALPDFVQDHLVMEQWYNTIGTPKSTSPVSVDFDQLPDFALNNINSELRARIVQGNDMPFDLTYNSTSIRSRTPVHNSSPTIPLDLPPPNLDIPFDLPRRRTPPSDLPPDLTDNNNTSCTARSGGGFAFSNLDLNQQSSLNPNVDKIQRLPDFLSDGPIHSSGRLADVTHDTPHFNSPDNNDNIHHRLQLDNERLRREVEDSRRVINDQTRQLLELEHSLEMARSSETQYNATLAQSMEDIEENLDKSYLRAATAESLANKLKQKVKKLTAEIEVLRRENESLKEEGAVGGAGMRSSNRFSQTQELSRELRLAASTAENNLRQLLTGVDNLRMIATTIENIDRIEISHLPDDFMSDSDDNDVTGPAL